MRVKKRIAIRILFVAFSSFLMVYPVSAVGQINYWDTSLLVPISSGGTDYEIVGQSIIVTSTSAVPYAYYRFADTRLQNLAGQKLTFSFAATSSGDNKAQINVEFYLDGTRVGITYGVGRRITVNVPADFDELRFVVYSNCGGTAVAGDTVTYTDIKLMGPGVDTVTGLDYQIGIFFVWSVELLKSAMGIITSNVALLIVCVAMPVIGLSVGLLCRIKS